MLTMIKKKWRLNYILPNETKIKVWQISPMQNILTFWSQKELLTFWSNGKLLTFCYNGNLSKFWSNLFSNHVDNHFCDIFVLLCPVGSFINSNRRKLMDG